MNRKQIRIAVDVLMFAAFLLLMEYHLLPSGVHEWLGIAVFCLFLLHNVLNYRWYGALFKGRYTVMRGVQTAVNFLLVAMMLCCMVSAVLIPGRLFAWVNLQHAMIGRSLHMKSTAWTFVLMCVHLGSHWGRFVGMTKRMRIPARRRTAAKWILRVAVAGVALYGVLIFLQRRFYEELFVAEVFKGNFAEASALAAVIFFLQTAAMAIAFTSASYYLKKLGNTIIKQRKEKTE